MENGSPLWAEKHSTPSIHRCSQCDQSNGPKKNSTLETPIRILVFIHHTHIREIVRSKMPKTPLKAGHGSSKSASHDERFAKFQTDPRFRLPSKKQTKTTIDKRFSRMLQDEEFTATAKVDRYGRRIASDTKKKALRRLYREEDEEEENQESGQEEQNNNGDDGAGLDGDSDDDLGHGPQGTSKKYDPARGGGFSSSSESDSDSEGESVVGDEDDVATGGVGNASKNGVRDQEVEVEVGEVTNRIAIVNLDWDHIKSIDLFALFSSFNSTAGGRIEKISIYPSEFGKERMKAEELEGPPKAIFKGPPRLEDDEDSSDQSSAISDDEAADEDIKKELLQEGDDQDFDTDALRSYQLDRLRYYYAVMVCSDKTTAHQIYDATDGREYQSSSNFLDLRFIPDDVTFDDEPRDESTQVPEGYKPIEFVTDALQHSKVKLTWDMHPEETSRKESIKRAFSGSRAEIQENDLRAYLASDSEGEDNDVKGDEVADEEAPKLTKKELARKKMREALGLSEESIAKSSKSGPVGDMQITFSAALTDKETKKKSDKDAETTIEKYMRKERERKERKREIAKARRDDQDPNEIGQTNEEEGDGNEDLGFDDPFFTAEEPAKASGSAARKEERRKKREAREAEAAEKAEQKAQLELLMADNPTDAAEHLDHFDMNEILRSEKDKRKGKKGKKGKKPDVVRSGLQEGFELDVADDRFKAVFERHDYAIDPSNPKYKATEGMKKLLETSRKKRKDKAGMSDDEPPSRVSKKSKNGRGNEELSGLVASVKRKVGRK
jgi:hypothetical protein